MAKDIEKLKGLLKENETAIVQKWLDCVLETYPADSANFLRTQKDQFANPVGNTIKEELRSVFHELVHEDGNEGVKAFLDKIIRIRAVQDFSPAVAIAFVFDLKNIVREVIGKGVESQNVYGALSLFEARIDEMGLIAFNIYSECREKLYELRVREVKSSAYLLLKKANMIVETPEQESEPVM